MSLAHFNKVVSSLRVCSRGLLFLSLGLWSFGVQADAQCPAESARSLLRDRQINKLSYIDLLELKLQPVRSLSAKDRFILVLRHLPFAGTESQIEISYDLRSSGHVIFRALSGSLNGAASEGKFKNSRERALALTSIRQICSFSDTPGSVVLRWTSTFWEALAESAKAKAIEGAKSKETRLLPVVVDASVFEVDYYDEQHSVHWSISVSDMTEGPETLSLMRWMNRVRADVQGLSATSDKALQGRP